MLRVDLGMRPRDVRALAVPLENSIRRPSVSITCGGAAPVLPMPLVPSRQWLRRQPRLLPPLAQPALTAAAAAVTAVPKPPQRRLGEKRAAAFAATQLSGRYAALLRVLEELRFKSPGWEPRSVLDAAASGPGAALWSAHAVWPEALRVATAAEPRSEMVACAVRMLQALQAENSTAPMPSIRWVNSLPRLKNSAAPPRPFDLVILAYSLFEASTDEARRMLVRDAWRRCGSGGALVIVEPGTPAGSVLVREARALVLREEQKLQVRSHIRLTL
jgi:ribosomal protein RSM22 (predicted rRNA methylase)